MTSQSHDVRIDGAPSVQELLGQDSSARDTDKISHVVPVPPEETPFAGVILQHEGDGASRSSLFWGLVVVVVDKNTFALMSLAGLSKVAQGFVLIIFCLTPPDYPLSALGPLS